MIWPQEFISIQRKINDCGKLVASIYLNNVKGILNSFKQLLPQIFHSIISLYLAFAEKA